jgi:cytochrome c oxidase subunit 3/cytochrome o ubiquinol oxidase subunit 3
MGIVEEEMDESIYWMDLLIESGLVRQELLTDLLQEANEILAMVVSSIRTSRNGIRRNPQSAIRNPQSAIGAGVMSASTLTGGDRHVGDAALYQGRVGLVCFYVSEAHMFGALIAAFLMYLQHSRTSDTPPAQVLGLQYAIPGTVFLLSSSGTAHLATKGLRRGSGKRFVLWWLATILLGTLFVLMTGLEWNDLIVGHGLTLGRNLFGTTYFSLIGLHATHVSVGVLLMLTVLGLFAGGAFTTAQTAGAELVSWYWHFVDGVWVVIFTVVYIVGRMG